MEQLLNSNDLPRILSPPPVIPRWLRWRLDRDVIFGRLKVLGWASITKGPLAFVYFVFNAEGVLHFNQDSATKLSDLAIPFAAYLADFEATYQLQVNHMVAELLLVLSFISWYFLLLWVINDEFKEKFRSWNWNARWVERIFLTTSITIICVDMGLFYSSLTYSAFGSSSFAPYAVIGTLGYGMVLLMTNFVTLYLRRQLREAKDNRANLITVYLSHQKG